LTIVDFDAVDVSNLHRQVIHRSDDVGMNKAKSARRAVHDLNPTISCSTIQAPLTESNALSLISQHDCIVDASDNPQTRYLINDACVLSGKPLVSGSAMGMEGQLTVYNYQDGPCYRCLYPKPNATEGSKSCADNGVLGPVPGMIGVLQAVETMKVLTGVG
jgi:adenylyltransferase and sulfurtransferase